MRFDQSEVGQFTSLSGRQPGNRQLGRRATGERVTGMNDTQEPRARHIVLIVDDDEIVLQVFRELLDGEGLRVIATRSARCALRFAERAIPHLVMSDVMMPEMSGLSLCRRFKANPRTAQVPVVLTSGQGQTVDVERGIAAGAVDYIKKPFDRDEVRFRVRAHLRSQDLKLQQQRAHDQLAAISRAARDAIMLTDSQQNITHWNEAASSLFGYSSAEALGRNVIQLIAPQQVHLRRRSRRRCLRRGQRFRSEKPPR